MASYRGKNLTLTIDGQAMHSEARSLSVDVSADALDSTVYGADARAKEPGLSDGSISLEMLDQSGGNWTGTWAETKPGTKGAWVLRPEGAGAGLREMSFSAVITGRSINYPYDDLVVISITAEIDGAITESTQA